MNEGIRPTLREIYSDWEVEDDTLDAVLDKSLNPRSPELLLEKMAALGITRDSTVLDLGCGDGKYSAQLATRFGCRIIGIDLIRDRLLRSGEERDGTPVLVPLVQADAQALPFGPETFEFIWCRDMLNHVADLGQAVRECASVLKPGGSMLIYCTFATELLEPGEARRLYQTLAIIPENMSPVYAEAAFRQAGLVVVERDLVDSEWREYWEEGEQKVTSRGLLRLARMRRARDRFVEAIGPIAYEVEFANYLWGVFQMLGKLCPTVYALRKVS